MTEQAGPEFITTALTVADINAAIDNDPRILDLKLAECLGFERERNIRKLIERHFEALQRFGEVCSIWSKPGKTGGRPGTEFWLNKRQALYITAKSDTPRAADLTVQMVDVFDAFLAGRDPGESVPVKAHHRSAPRRALPPAFDSRTIAALCQAYRFLRADESARDTAAEFYAEVRKMKRLAPGERLVPPVESGDASVRRLALEIAEMMSAHLADERRRSIRRSIMEGGGPDAWH